VTPFYFEERLLGPNSSPQRMPKLSPLRDVAASEKDAGRSVCWLRSASVIRALLQGGNGECSFED